MSIIRSLSVFENVSQSKVLLKKIGLTTDDPNYKEIRQLLAGKDGYVNWFCELFFVQKINMDEIKQIVLIINTEKNVISKFSKPIIELKSLEKFWDEYLRVKYKSNAKDVFNQFPSNQKKFIDLSNEDDAKLLNDLANDKGKDDFIGKVSRYHNKEDLIDALKNFLYNRVDKDSILQSLKKDGVNIIKYDPSNNIIIFQVNYEQIKKYGSDTSWCIVGSKSVFNSYQNWEFPKQIIILLTDRTDNYSKIGVSTNEYGYVTAHLKNDKHFSEIDLRSLLKERDVEFKLFLPDLSEIDKEILHTIPVRVLIDYGIPKEEVIKNRSVFKSINLMSFTEEEIEKWNLRKK